MIFCSHEDTKDTKSFHLAAGQRFAPTVPFIARYEIEHRFAAKTASSCSSCLRVNKPREGAASIVIYNLEFDPVPVKEIEAPAGVVVAMAEGFETGCEHGRLGLG